VSAYCTINAALDLTNVATVQSARPGGRNLSSEMKMRTRQDTSTSRENKMVTFYLLPVPTVDAGFQRMSRMRADERSWLRLPMLDILLDWWQAVDAYRWRARLTRTTMLRDEHESIHWLSYGNRARDAKCYSVEPSEKSPRKSSWRTTYIRRTRNQGRFFDAIDPGFTFKYSQRAYPVILFGPN
jgi:hypothetical protein